MNLYDVAMEYAQLEELITELDGQSGETVDESLHAAFRHAEGSLKDKVDGVLKLIRNAETDSDRFAEESNRFRKRSQVALHGVAFRFGQVPRRLRYHSDA